MNPHPLFIFFFGLHWIFVAVRGSYSLVVVRGLLIVAVSLVAEDSCRAHRLSGCGTQAQLPCGIWTLVPGPGD